MFQTIEFSSLDELCTIISSGTADWDTRWFRGCRSPEYSLLPTLFREDSLKKREGYLAIEFRRRAHSRLKNISSQFDWLCAMQHYGIPTRLLDWTESLAVALFFSVGNTNEDDARPTIWVLDPFALADMNGEPQIIPIASHESVVANADIAFRDDWEKSKKEITNLPLPVAPNFLFDRLTAQNGVFTIHGSDERPLDDLVNEVRPKALIKLVASAKYLTSILNSIQLIRPNPDAIFPDVDGMKIQLV